MSATWEQRREAAAAVGRQVVIYTRQSHGDKVSLEEQEELGVERAEDEGWAIAAKLSDGSSASRHAGQARDDWPQLLDMVAGGRVLRPGDVVWLWEASRGDRKADAWLAFLRQCRDAGIVLYIEDATSAYDMGVLRDWKAMADAGVSNEYESELTHLRTMRSKNSARRAAAKGQDVGKMLRKVYGGRARYGWRDTRPRHADDPPDRGWVVDPEQAKVLQGVAEAMLVPGAALWPVYRELTANGPLYDSYGRALTYHRLRTTLLMPLTAGYITEHAAPVVSKRGKRRRVAAPYTSKARKVTDGPVDEDTWQAVRSVFGERPAGKPATHQYPLAKLLRCSICGNQLTGIGTKGAPAYACREPHPRLGVTKPCLGTHIRVDVVHEVISGRLAKWAERSPRAQQVASRRLNLEPKLAKARAEKARLDSRQTNLDLRIDQGRGTQEDWDRRQEELDAAYARVQAELDALQQTAGKAPLNLALWDDPEAEPDDKRQLIAEIFQTPIVVAGRLGYGADQYARLDPQLRD